MERTETYIKLEAKRIETGAEAESAGSAFQEVGGGCGGREEGEARQINTEASEALFWKPCF